jgi:opacity protein-like surface antigen
MRRLSTRLIVAIATLALAQMATAADLPRKAPAYEPPPPPVYNWTGFYVGGNLGYGWGDSSYSFSADNGAGQGLLNTGISGGITPRAGSFRTTGIIGGGQLGYNWQFGKAWVAGIEADIAASSVGGNGSPAATTNLGHWWDSAGPNSWQPRFGLVRHRQGQNRLFAHGTFAGLRDRGPRLRKN